MEEQTVDRSERELAMGALDEHRKAERLDAEEYRRRSATASQARTRAELDDLFADLPAPHPTYPRPPGPRDGAGSVGEMGHRSREVDLPELVTPWAERIARHAGLLAILAPVIAVGLFALTGFRFPILLLLVPVSIGVITYISHRHGR